MSLVCVYNLYLFQMTAVSHYAKLSILRIMARSVPHKLFKNITTIVPQRKLTNYHIKLANSRTVASNMRSRLMSTYASHYLHQVKPKQSYSYYKDSDFS